MNCLNEPIVRRANAEDRCTGHLWESRFHSQALMSDEAVVTAMAYVDLNPVRAGIAKTPEAADYTSVRARLNENSTSTALRRSISESLKSGELRRFNVPMRPLLPISDAMNAGESPQVPILRNDYLALLDVTGHVDVAGNRGRINPALEPILERLGISKDVWPLETGGLNPFVRQQARRVKKQA